MGDVERVAVVFACVARAFEGRRVMRWTVDGRRGLLGLGLLVLLLLLLLVCVLLLLLAGVSAGAVVGGGVVEQGGDVHGEGGVVGGGREEGGSKVRKWQTSIENAVADHRGNRDRYLATALTS